MKCTLEDFNTSLSKLNYSTDIRREALPFFTVNSNPKYRHDQSKKEEALALVEGPGRDWELESVDKSASSASHLLSDLFFFKDFIYFLLERKEGREKERERKSVCERYINQLSLTCTQPRIWPITRACALTGNRTCDFLVYRPALSPLTHTSQGSLSELEQDSPISFSGLQYFLKLRNLYPIFMVFIMSMHPPTIIVFLYFN